ncbi:hypothetical protein V7087_07490 [Neobacillus niacini]
MSVLVQICFGEEIKDSIINHYNRVIYYFYGATRNDIFNDYNWIRYYR